MYHPKRALPEGLPTRPISSLATDPEGGLWVGILRWGLVHVLREGERVSGYEHYGVDPDAPHALNDDEILAVLIIPEAPEVVWVGTNGRGLCRLNRQTKAVTCYRPVYADAGRSGASPIFALGALPCTPGLLWVGMDDGLHVFDTAEGVFTPVLLAPETDAPAP